MRPELFIVVFFGLGRAVTPLTGGEPASELVPPFFSTRQPYPSLPPACGGFPQSRGPGRP